MTGAELVARILKEHGVAFVSTLCGNGIDPVLYACRGAGMRVIDTHNEQTAAYMAESYARLTGRIGVCAVSSAVGFTNALIGAVNAWFDGAPMLLIAGASDHAYAGRGSFQDFDQVTAARPIFKYAHLVDRADTIAFHVREAIVTAISGRPGPVHLTIPLDVLAADVGQETPTPATSAQDGIVRPRGAAPPDAVAEAAAVIGAASRPLLIAGSGLFYAHAEDVLASLVTQTNMPVVVPIWDRGCIASPLPQFMGVIGAASGSAPLLDAADLVVVAGAKVDYRVGYLHAPAVSPGLRIIRISADPSELRQGAEPDIALTGDPRTVLEQLCAALPAVPNAAQTEWLKQAQERNRQFRSRWLTPPAPSGQPISGHHIVEALRPYVQDATFIVDGGNIGQWMHMVLCDRYPGHWLTCGASGVVGFGLGAAMAAKLAFPSRPAILLSGDGSMGFNTADLESAVRHDLPFVVVVANDRAWGIVVSGQSKRFGADDTVACKLGPIRFDLLAEACGAVGVHVEDAAALSAAIEQGLAAQRPVVIDVATAQGGPAD